jgi:hypothetical protein
MVSVLQTPVLGLEWAAQERGHLLHGEGLGVRSCRRTVADVGVEVEGLSIAEGLSVACQSVGARVLAFFVTGNSTALSSTTASSHPVRGTHMRHTNIRNPAHPHALASAISRSLLDT